MQKAYLEVASMTLEPIAALNAAIPADLRLLNLALVDIGAGTSDIAVCRDGSVVGYTMATVAGDEITEALMRACLVDFPTAEAMKLELGRSKSVSFTDILGLEQTLLTEELFSLLDGPIQALADEIAQRICQVNGGPPSAVFLVGGEQAPTLCARVAAALGIDSKRAALAGGYFQSSAYSDTFALSDPEYTTPLGIAVSAYLGLISDSYQVLLNGSPPSSSAAGALRCWSC
ncbi:rod shape-determining protein [Flavonifractor plautii]|nr:rod shape-determining protein [Flavonifractor plautii]